MRPSIPLCAFIAATTLLANDSEFQDLNITYQKNTNQPSISANQISTSDTASLFNDVASFSTYTGGQLSNIPVIRGLNDDRIKIEVEGMPLTSSCPNHMNTPLSYIDPKKVQVIDLIAGITPVSMSGDSIAGTIAVDSGKLLFSDKGYNAGGELAGYWRSANFSQDGVLSLYGMSEHFHVGYKGSFEQGGNYKNGNNQAVMDTLYAQRNNAGYLGYKNGSHYAKFEVGNQLVPYEGYVNQYMDLLGDNMTYANGAYKGMFGSTGVDIKGFWKMTTHYMNFISGQRWPYPDANTKNTPMYTQNSEFGANAKFLSSLTDAHNLGCGIDFHNYFLNDWWPAAGGTMMGMNPNTYQAINNAHRNKYGIFAESNYEFSETLSSLIGIRYDNIAMNTGNVNGYNNGAASGKQYAMAANYPIGATWFNNQNRAKTFNMFDITALGKYKFSNAFNVEFGYGRKNRAPNVYELYAWAGQDPTTQNGAMPMPVQMDMRMTNWFGDGNGYAGNLSLKQETANIFSVTTTLNDSASKVWQIKATPYYNYVQNYIDVNRIGRQNVSGTTGMFGAVPINMLQFANHDAVLFGLDLNGAYKFYQSQTFGNWALKASGAYTRGYRTDGYNLYNIMPLNGKLTLEQKFMSFDSAIDLQGIASKEAVESLRLEQTTPGYALMNFRTSYEWSKYLRIDFAITNLLDKFYYQPLGGVNIAGYEAAGSVGRSFGSVRGEGRSYNVGVRVKF